MVASWPWSATMRESCHSLPEASTTDGVSLTFCQIARWCGGQLEIFRGFRLFLELARSLQRKQTEGERQMEMLLMGACLSMLGLAVACMAFGAATRDSVNASPAVPAVEDRSEERHEG